MGGFSVAVSAVILAMLAQSAATPPRAAPPTVTRTDIKKHEGREVISCGRVVMYDCDDGSGLVLDFDTPGTTRDGVSVELARGLWSDPLGQGLTNQYVFANVCARGKVAKRGGRYRVVVTAADAIEIVAPPPAGAIQLAPSAVQSCARGVQPPELLREVKPEYTGDAMRGKQEGLVYLEAVVLPSGSVGDIRVLAGLEPELGLNANAVKALQQWRFKPATLGGRTVPVLVTVEMTFTLK